MGSYRRGWLVKSSIYAGSFDPWSFGHQYVLDAALAVFDKVHVLTAVNPAKKGTLSPEVRARVIAHAIDPFVDWWSRKPPFRIGRRVVVAATTGLVSDYAVENAVTTLVRGLRSTSDFEAEFNLYFSNRAINPGLQTWAIMCPPELLHCSSTYVRTVVGHDSVRFVGTSFLAQSLMLHKAPVIGEIFDLIQACSSHRFEWQPADLEKSDLNAALQQIFGQVLRMDGAPGTPAEGIMRECLGNFLEKRGPRVRELLGESRYPELDVAHLWSFLVRGMAAAHTSGSGFLRMLKEFDSHAQKLGKTQIPLFDAELVEKVLLEAARKN